MQVADSYNPQRAHYLVICDFHHKSSPPVPSKDDSTKTPKTKKTLSGTGTSTSSNCGRQELYQEFLVGKLLLEDVIEDVDPEIMVGKHFHFPSSMHLVASSSIGPHTGSIVDTASSQFDANLNPIGAADQFPSTSDIPDLNKEALDMIESVKADPVVVQTICIEAPDSLRITYIAPTKDGAHLYVALCPTEGIPESTSNQMDIDEDSEFFASKGYMYWDHNDVQANGEVQRHGNALLLVYALDFSEKTVKLAREPLLRRELPPEHAPVEQVLLPLREKRRSNCRNEVVGPQGRVAMVCKDGALRMIDFGNFNAMAESRLEKDKFVSVAYCNSELTLVAE